MDVTAIMEKTVKNTGGVAALQKNLKKIQKILYHSDVMLGFDNEIRMLCYILLRINLHCSLAFQLVCLQFLDLFVKTLELLVLLAPIRSVLAFVLV